MGIRLRQSTNGKELKGTVSGQVPVWNNATQEWDVGSAGHEIEASNQTVPFDMPSSGGYGTPDGMTVIMPTPGVIGDRYLVQYTAEIFESGGFSQSWEGAIEWVAGGLQDDVYGPFDIAANGRANIGQQFVITLTADDPTPTFRASFRAFGAGPDVVGGSISVIKLGQ